MLGFATDAAAMLRSNQRLYIPSMAMEPYFLQYIDKNYRHSFLNVVLHVLVNPHVLEHGRPLLPIRVVRLHEAEGDPKSTATLLH